MYGNKECVCVTTGTEMVRERESVREGRVKVGQTAAIQNLSSLLSCFILPSFSCLLPLRGSEGGHLRLQALNQPGGDLACPGYSARSLCLSACYTAILLPSLCSWCQVTMPQAQRCRSTRCPLFCSRCAKNSEADSSVFHQC